MTITHLGKTFNTGVYQELTDHQYQDLKEQILALPDFTDVEKQLKALHNGKVKINHIVGYYFKHLMYEGRNAHSKWSVMEALESKEIMEHYYGYLCRNTKVFPEDKPLATNIETAFRISSRGCANKLPNFPIKTIDMLLEKYTKEGDKYYDYSCGWGVRMLSTLRSKRNYYGTDPNSRLVAKLEECKADYDKVNATTTFADIRPQGSEIFVPEWENQMDFIFSSPPYFALEIYHSENQSYQEGMEYQYWLDSWFKPTVDNCKRYLKDTGTFALNIKDAKINSKVYPLEKDMVAMVLDNGFELVDTLTLKNIKRNFGSKAWDKHTMGTVDNTDENIYIFRKK